MKRIPETEASTAVIRTDFSDDPAWHALVRLASRPVNGNKANLDFISDPAFSGLTQDELIQRLPDDYNHQLILVADGLSMSEAGHPLLVVEVPAGQTFRALAEQMSIVENNLAIGEMEFGDFIYSLAEDGIFRGFPRR